MLNKMLFCGETGTQNMGRLENVYNLYLASGYIGIRSQMLGTWRPEYSGFLNLGRRRITFSTEDAPANQADGQNTPSSVEEASF